MRAADIPATKHWTGGRIRYRHRGKWVTVHPFAIEHSAGHTYLHIKHAAHELKSEWEVEVLP